MQRHQKQKLVVLEAKHSYLDDNKVSRHAEKQSVADIR